MSVSLSYENVQISEAPLTIWEGDVLVDVQTNSAWIVDSVISHALRHNLNTVDVARVFKNLGIPFYRATKIENVLSVDSATQVMNDQVVLIGGKEHVVQIQNSNMTFREI